MAHSDVLMRISAKYRWYLYWLWFVLLGLAVAGKGFAYIGLSPVYISDVTLAWGMLLVVSDKTNILRIADNPIALCIALFVSYGIGLSLLGLEEYGIDAFRDGALIGYGAFALITYGLLSVDRTLLTTVLNRYQRFSRWFLFACGPIFFIALLMSKQLPVWPNTTVTMLHSKPGDILVHLGALGASLIIGANTFNATQVALWGLTTLSIMVTNRGGTLAVVCALSVALTLKLRSQGSLAPLAALPMLICLAFIVNINVEAAFGKRTFTPQQLVKNVTSIVSDSTDTQDLSGTKKWRIEWWKKIVDYTFFGDNFWSGKGFGINLASADGFQLESGLLRSPHNSHLTILGRAGVPGFLFYMVVQISWLWYLVRALRLARRLRLYVNYKLMTVVLCYWVALNINATFDPVFEGPMGGAWFWSIVGLGLVLAEDTNFIARRSREHSRIERLSRLRSQVATPSR